jgi:hypothetical protein
VPSADAAKITQFNRACIRHYSQPVLTLGPHSKRYSYHSRSYSGHRLPSPLRSLKKILSADPIGSINIPLVSPMNCNSCSDAKALTMCGGDARRATTVLTRVGGVNASGLQPAGNVLLRGLKQELLRRSTLEKVSRRLCGF